MHLDIDVEVTNSGPDWLIRLASVEKRTTEAGNQKCETQVKSFSPARRQSP